MAHIVKGHRWNLPIPFKIGSQVPATVRSLIRQAIADIERDTKLRFKTRRNEDEYIQFKPNDDDNSGNSGIGENPSHLGFGGKREVKLGSGVDLSVVIHEICHAVGMFHEQTRRDRNRHVEIIWSHIHPDHKHNYEMEDKDTSKHIGAYDLNSIMHYSGREFGMYDWSEGWTSVLFDRVDTTNLLFILKKDNGHIHVHEMNNGIVGSILQKKNWSPGFTQMQSYRINGRSFLILLKEENGIVKIHPLTAAGIGSNEFSYNWSKGWTSLSFLETNTKTHMLLLKKDGGDIHIHSINDNGSVGDRTFTDNWSNGWTQAKLFKVGSSNFLFLLKEETGLVKIHKFVNGKVGELVKQYNWSKGWTSVEFYYKSGNTYLFLLKKSSGKIHVHEMNSTGHVGTRTDTKNWGSDYTSLAIRKNFTSGNGYLFILKEKNGHGHIHYLNNNGTIGDEAVPSTMISKSGAPMGGSSLTATDILALNRLA